MIAWLNPLNWRRLLRRNQYRDGVAFLFWQQLERVDAVRDDDETLQRVADVVTAVENGNEGSLLATDVQLLQAVRQDSLGVRLLQGLPALAKDHPSAMADWSALAKQETRRLRSSIGLGRGAKNFRLTSHIPTLVPLFSAFLFFSGFVYNFLLFARFNLQVQPYFGLSDYLSASIAGVVPVLIALIVPLLMAAFMPSMLRASVIRHRLGTAVPGQALTTVIMLLTYLALPVVMRWGYGVDEQFIELLRIYLLLVLIGPTLASPLAARAPKPFVMSMAAIFVLLYVAVIWFVAVAKQHGVTHSPRPPRTEIHFADSARAPQRWRIVTGNSLYLFAMDEACLLHAIPLQQITEIRQLPAPPEPEEAEAEANGKAVNNQQDKPWCTPIVSPAEAVAPAPSENPKTAVPIAK